jgi:hypothetical protein
MSAPAIHAALDVNVVAVKAGELVSRHRPKFVRFEISIRGAGLEGYRCTNAKKRTPKLVI